MEGKSNDLHIGEYNGGGYVTTAEESSNEDDQVKYGSPGRGATDIRLLGGIWNNFDSLKSRIMVATGGAGAGDRNLASNVESYYGAGNGGAGGELEGISGQSINYGTSSSNTYNEHGYGTGGTQTSGGYSIWLNYENEVVSKTLIGKFGYVGGSSQSGGGSGYYGGGNASHGAGGGGSSFISGYTGCDAINASSTENNIIHTGQPNHYSGLVFTETNMIAGNKSMPSHDGKTTMTGNSGNGYARITVLSCNN